MEQEKLKQERILEQIEQTPEPEISEPSSLTANSKKATTLEKILTGVTMAGIAIGAGIEYYGYFINNQDYINYGLGSIAGGIVFGIITLAQYRQE